MAITNFIPTIWSENLLSSLNHHYIGVANCNRDYEGEIKNRGSSVKICGVGNITIGDYTKDTDMSTPQDLSDTLAELIIDQAKYFNFQVDDIDKTQCSPKLLDAAMRNAANALANTADKYVFSLYGQAAQKFDADLSTDSIIDIILKSRELLYTNNVTDPSDIVIELSPAAATKLIKEQADVFSYNNDILSTGCIGSVAGCKVFVSNNISIEDGPTQIHHCLMRSKRSIAFAEQLSEIEAYRPEKRFADAVKGLHLYGAKVVYPDEIIDMEFTVEE
ncbi:MAG: P22 coat protein - protein 5 domain protein [Clostridia bacterium]|nr:P22 coat protein - protein 5 domain protein [Clostridia bacterium]